MSESEKTDNISATEATPADSASNASAAPTQTATAAWIGKVRSSLTAAVPARSALVAGGIGFVAGAGLLTAAVSAPALGHLFATTASPPPWNAAIEDIQTLKRSIAKLDAKIASLKTSVDAATRHANTQRAQITERTQHEARAQTDMQARLTKIDDAIDRLEKRATAAAAADITGSVAPRYAAAAAGAPAPAAKPAEPPIVKGWVIRHISHGHALVANRNGMFEAAPGLLLPELGRVQAVTRKDGRWVVVTDKGIITTAMRRPRPMFEYAPE
jgi:hypothetical protein